MNTPSRLAKAFTSRLPRLLAGESGQAASEYALISTLMLLGAGMGGYWFMYKGLMNAYNTYMGSIHFVLNLALP